jgi:hypothetical protein
MSEPRSPSRVISNIALWAGIASGVGIVLSLYSYFNPPESAAQPLPPDVDMAIAPAPLTLTQIGLLVSAGGLLLAFLTLAVNTVFGWRRDKREGEEHSLKVAQLELENAKLRNELIGSATTDRPR